MIPQQDALQYVFQAQQSRALAAAAHLEVAQQVVGAAHEQADQHTRKVARQHAVQRPRLVQQREEAAAQLRVLQHCPKHRVHLAA